MSTCLICGSSNLTRVPYPSSGNPLQLQCIELCQDCDFGRAHTKLTQTELDQFYQQGHYWHGVPPGESAKAHNRFQAEMRVLHVLEQLRSFPAPRVLDVGAGLGDIGYYLRRHRPDAIYCYTEPDASARAEIHRKLPSAISASDDRESRYDLIFINHVLEHTLEPQTFLASFRRQLTPRGFLYVEVPNRDDRLKPDVFPHTLFFSQRSLRLLAEQTGMELLGLRTFGRMPRPAAHFRDRVITSLFHRTSKVPGLSSVTKLLDRALFRYDDEHSDGIWHGLLMQQPGGPRAV